jgi:hypothetical protein
MLFSHLGAWIFSFFSADMIFFHFYSEMEKGEFGLGNKTRELLQLLCLIAYVTRLDPATLVSFFDMLLSIIHCQFCD